MVACTTKLNSTRCFVAGKAGDTMAPSPKWKAQTSDRKSSALLSSEYVPVIHCISTIAVRWTWRLIDLCSYTPALWSRSTPSPGHTCSSTPNIVPMMLVVWVLCTAGTNDDRPQTPILSAAPVTMSISVLCFCCLKMLESHSLLLRIHLFHCLS
jgi:hypothetical protein